MQLWHVMSAITKTETSSEPHALGLSQRCTCRPQLFVNLRSRGIRFEAVFMMKAAEDRRCGNTIAVRKAMIG